MDDDLGANSPYQNMNSGEDEIQPEFLRKRSSGSGALAAAEKAASVAVAAKTGKVPGGMAAVGKKGEKTFGESVTGPGKDIKNGSSASKAGADNDTNGSPSDGLYNSRTTGNKETSEASLNFPTGMKAAAPFAILLVAIIGIVFLIIGLPVIMIGAIDYNLQKVLGFEDTVGILEKQGEYVTAEMLGAGKVPPAYASDLASNGIEVGQLLSNGEFVKTNEYIADIEAQNGLVAAASGFSYISDKEGELALLYENEIISADDFVAKVESDPKLYAAYSAAADISTKYYYGDDVEAVYQDMGISRGNFNDWESSGNYDEDEKAYREILTYILDNGSGLTVGGALDNAAQPTKEGVDNVTTPTGTGGTWSKDVSSGEAETISSQVATETKKYITGWTEEEYAKTDASGAALTDENGNTVKGKRWKPEFSQDETARAAELLNTAVSSGEPYLAANAFIAIEEPIQRARVDGNGPVNLVMNTLTQGTEVSYQNVQTGASETKKLAILETDNFRAAVSDAPYSLDEAWNFGRDRMIKATGQTEDFKKYDTISGTTTASDGKTNSSSVVRNGQFDSADAATLAKANESLSIAVSKKNSELFQTVVGGNRIVEGGSFLSNTINSKVIGAMPSDSKVIAKYQDEVDEVIARKAEAERATLSPFDVSSPNTFLGNIVHNIASVALKNYGSGMTAISAIASAGGSAGRAVSALTGTAIAEGVDQNYTTLSGSGCDTVKTVNVEGDIYCTAHTTASTDYMKYTSDDWKNTIVGESLDGRNIKEGSQLEQFITMGMDRYATVGVMSADVCEKWHEYNDNAFEKLVNKFSDMMGLYNVCKSVDKKISTGAFYTYSEQGDENAKLYGGYVLYDQVYSLLSESQSSVSVARANYYEKHPADKSLAGQIAMRSGMSVSEAEIALSYSGYLNEIARYDASSSYAFHEPFLVFEDESIIDIHSRKIAGDLYAWQQKESEYEDLRTRNYVV